MKVFKMFRTDSGEIKVLLQNDQVKEEYDYYDYWFVCGEYGIRALPKLAKDVDLIYFQEETFIITSMTYNDGRRCRLDNLTYPISVINRCLNVFLKYAELPETPANSPRLGK